MTKVVDNRIVVVAKGDETYFNIVKQFANKNIDVLSIDMNADYEMLKYNPDCFKAFLFDINTGEYLDLIQRASIDHFLKPRLSYFNYNSEKLKGYFLNNYFINSTNKPFSNMQLDNIQQVLINLIF